MESYSEIKPLSVRPFRISNNEQKFLFPKGHCYGHFYPLSISKTLSFLVIMLFSTIQMLKITLFVEGFFHDIYAWEKCIKKFLSDQSSQFYILFIKLTEVKAISSLS